MELLINVINQKLKLATNLKNLVAGSQQFIKLTFNLSEEWDDLLTFAQFIQSENAYSQYLDSDNSVYLPSEIQKGVCKLALCGTGSQGEGSHIIATTNYLELNIDENILVSNASSTDISESLYTQLVERFNRIADLSESDYSDLIVSQVNTIMAGYLSDGSIAAATIQDGSIARSKVNSAFEATLAKADTAMQPSEYGEGGTKDVFAFADSKAAIVQQDLNTTKAEIVAAYKVTNPATGTVITSNNLKDSVNKVLELAENYTQSALRDHKSYSTKIVSVLPQIGEANTFYLIPNSAGNGYDKWWYITDESDNESPVSRWDCFGSATTIVVSSLPQSGANDVDYILKTVNGCLYYKWIDNQWNLVGGSMAEVVNELPQSGSELIDYYVPNSDGVYLHYRWINNDFELIGSDSYSKSEVDGIIQSLSTTIGNRISSVESNVQTNETNINSLSRAIDTVTNNLDNLDTEGYTYSLALSTDESTGNNVLNFTQHKQGEEDNVTTITLPSGGGGSSSTTTIMTIDRITQTPLVITADSPAIIEMDFSSVDSDNSAMDSTYTWKLGSQIIMTGTLNQGRNTFDLSNYCTVGTQKFIFTATDGYSTSVKTWTVKKVDVRIESSFNDATINAIGKSVSFTYIPYGSVSKTIHFKLDGAESTVTTTASGTIQSYTIPAQTHGSHFLEVWATANINGVPVETSHIYKDIIWYDPDKDGNNNYLNPVIGCTYRFDYYGNLTARQYDTTSIVYNVFDPSNDYPTVKRYVDNVLVGEDTISSSQNTWNFMSPDVGLHTLRIECGNTSVIIKIQVNELGIDVSPVTANLEIDFNPTGINNNSSNRIWSNDNYAMTVSENFDWVNGGYKIDENGDSYFLIKAGTRATFNYNMFAGNVLNNIKQTGAEMKICFMTENVQNINAVWLSNVETTTIEVDGETQTTNVGLQLGAHEGWLKTNTAKSQNTTDANGKIIVATNTYLYTPYSEEDIIEMDVNIGSVGSNDKGYIMAYEDGVPSKAFAYGSLDRLYQYTPQPLIIGSDYCDVRIYRMKLYSSSLSSEDIMRNFIADSRDATTMLQRYDRNSIYYHSEHGYSPYSSNGTLDPVKLAPLIPNVKVLMLDTEHFTLNKKNFVKSSLRCIHAPGGDLYPGDPYYDNWLFKNGFHSGQGTTSDNYGASARNVDFIFNCDGVHFPYYDKNKRDPSTDIDPNYISQVTLGYGLGREVEHTETVTDWEGNSGKIALTRTSVPNNFFNFKVNVASSENVNNALFQKRYNDFLPYISPAKQRDSKIKNDMEFVPAILFIRENSEDLSQHTEFDDREWHFYALGNLGDSKKTDYTRAYDPEDMNEFTIEISDNTPNNAQFQTGVYYIYHEVNSPTIANIGNYFELIEGRYTPANSNTFSDSTTYYTRTRHLETYTMDSNGNPVSDANPQVCAYPITLSEWNENNMRYWCLHNEDFDGDHSFEPRYACCGDYRDGKLVNNTKGTAPEEKAQINKNNDVWRAFYRWVITSTDEEFVNELDEWCVRSAVEYFYAFTHMYTMIDNRAKNTFWHFAKTGTYRAVSKPVSELLHVYCELVNDEYVVTADTVINPNKTYYTQYAFDLWMYDGDTAVGINNNGELKFPYGKEDIDFNVDGDNQSGYLYNGALSVFWCRLRDLLPTEISNIFQDGSNPNRFKAGHLIKQFEDFQNCFPEEIWRLDIERKYIRTFSGQSIDGSKPVTDEKYLKEMMQGRKKYQRRQWIRDQEIYFGTKHLSDVMLSDGNQNVNQIIYRCYNPGDNANPKPNYNIKITPFSDMYVTARFGNSGAVSQKRAKAGVEYTIEISSNNATDTQVMIYAANRVQALNDLSANYLSMLDIANASRLRKLKIGDKSSDYRNTSLSSLELTNNKLLEELDIRNCTALSGSLDLTNCKNLVNLYAEGTTLQSVAFANNGRVKIAHLPNTINALEMRNLNNLSDFQATLNALTSLILEGGTIDSKQLISDHIDTLLSLQLYNINWTGFYALINTNLLNQIYSLGDGNTILTGNVYISNNVRLHEIGQFEERWKNLSIQYEGIVIQHLITFVNPDGTELYRMYCDYDASNPPPDPVATNLIETPTMASDDEYDYTYSAWADMPTTITSDSVVTAVYTKTKRRYTVSWYGQADANGNPIAISKLDEVEVDYGSEVSYEYQKVNSPTSDNFADYYEFTGGQYISSISLPSNTFSSTKTYYTKRDLPTDTSGETNGYYKLFKGWDKSTGFVKGNINVIAQWETRTGLPSRNTDLKDMSCVDIYAVCQAKLADKEVDENNGYWESKDFFEITLGHDLDFSNVTSKTLVDLDHPIFFNGSDGTNTGTRIVYNNGVGTTYQDSFIDFDGSNSTTNPEIKLFSADAPSFTLAIEYEYLSTNTNGVMLSAGSEDDVDGFKLNYSSSNPCIRWGNNNQVIGASDIRNVMVLRHVKGSDILYAYTYNSHSDRYTDIGNSSYPLRYMLQRTNTSGTEPVLSLGAVRYKNGVTHDYFVKGWVYWCKLWEDDLGDTNAKFLAAWIHEKIRMEYTGRGTSGLRRYAVANTNSQVTTYAEASFLANNSLSLLHNMNNSDTNAGGWATSNMRKFLNARVYNALPVQWRSAIKSVNVKSSIGGGSSGNKVTTTSTSVDKLYLAAYTELIGANSDYNGETYNNNIINYFVSNSSTYYYKKVKFIGLIIKNQGEDGTQYFGVNENLSIDPTDSSLGYTVNEGDVWFRYDGSNKIGYMYISEDTLAKHTRIGYRAVSSTDNIVASAGGRWVRAFNWWGRSPYVTHSTGFLFVNYYGNPYNSSGASYASGVAVGFSV